jgi:hypothetical protein
MLCEPIVATLTFDVLLLEKEGPEGLSKKFIIQTQRNGMAQNEDRDPITCSASSYVETANII